MTPNERKIYAQTLFDQHPESFPENRRDLILKGRIELGMTPFEARLAGGAFAYEVIADPSRWPPNTDPFKVMWAQSVSPDNSEIWMTFKNSTQFPGGAECLFRVHFQRGNAVDLEKVED